MDIEQETTDINCWCKNASLPTANEPEKTENDNWNLEIF